MTPDVQVWRIAADTPDYDAHDLSGKGAGTTGGRWNRKGVPVVYASESRALACLETVVHLAGSDPLPLNRYLVSIRIPMRVWDTRVVFDPAAHVGWDAEPAGRVSLDWGSEWLRARTGPLAQVPSVIVPEEWNLLINPAHSTAASMTAVKVRRWTYDHRFR